MTASIALTPGDPAGVGPAVLLQALHKVEITNQTIRLLGNPVIWEYWAERLHLPLDSAWELFEERRRVRSWEPGAPSLAAARESVEALNHFADRYQDKQDQALVTGPISKKWAQDAGFKFPGHTEFCADVAGTDDFAMFFWGPELNVVLTTIHLSLRDMLDAVTASEVKRVVRLVCRDAAKVGISPQPKMLLCGLNPHAGEEGVLGREEKEWLNAAALELKTEGFEISQPLPPDTAFAMYRKLWPTDQRYDLVVALYHDQGLIPFKMIHFDDGVNCTLGLPFFRSSPDHGTAYGLTSRLDQVSANSACNALELALKATR